MQERLPISDAESLALRAEPPRDDADELTPWQLGHRVLADQRFNHAVEHRGLTVHDSELHGFTWSGGVVLRGCVFRDVVLERVAFTNVHFEDVVFERCRLDTVQLVDCDLVRCRFVDCDMALITASRVRFTDAQFSAVRGDSWTLRECALLGCRIDECTLLALRAAKSTIDALDVRGGALRSAEFTLDTIGALRVADAVVQRLRVVGGELGAVTLTAVEADDLSLSTAQVDALTLERCPTVVNLRVLDARLRALTITACPQVLGLIVHACTLAQLSFSGSTLLHSTFEAVHVDGPLHAADAVFAGLVLRDGVWSTGLLERVRFDDYVAADHMRFTSLQKRDVVEGVGLRYQLDGGPAASGSMFWGALHGA